MQDKIFDLFTNDAPLMELMLSPQDMDNMNNRFRREEMKLEEITADKLPFIIFVFLPEGSQTQNYLVNKSLLEVSIYCNKRDKATKIYPEIKRILQSNFEDFQITKEGQKESGVRGIFKYVLRFKPLVNS